MRSLSRWQRLRKQENCYGQAKQRAACALERATLISTHPDDDEPRRGGDGREVALSRSDRRSPSDLLSAELENFGRDRVYEAAVSAV